MEKRNFLEKLILLHSGKAKPKLELSIVINLSTYTPLTSVTTHFIPTSAGYAKPQQFQRGVRGLSSCVAAEREREREKREGKMGSGVGTARIRQIVCNFCEVPLRIFVAAID